MVSQSDTLRIGYVGGLPRRINEKAIDVQWVQYLSEYSEMISIPPLQFMKLFGGSVEKWSRTFPLGLKDLSRRLTDLCDRYHVRTIYMNMPSMIPYLLMARNYGGVDVGFLFIAHSVGSEFWLKQWMAIAPWIIDRDVLLVSSSSSREALLNISCRFLQSKSVPLCIEPRSSFNEFSLLPKRRRNTLLSIGRLEDVKNIDLLLECFAEIQKRIPDAHLTVAGEYTGFSELQKENYKQKLEGIVVRLHLQNCVDFVGPVEGERKDMLFKQSDILVNLSTDPGETFGFNLIEALSWGKPIICSNWDGFCDIVESDKHAFLIDCHWEGDYPVLNRTQMIDSCVRLLEDDQLYWRYATACLDRLHKFDYRRIAPLIVEHVQKALIHTVPATPERVMDLALRTPIEMPSIYPNASKLSFFDEPILNLCHGDVTESYESWMPKVKSIIGHFAGGNPSAKL